MKIEGKPEESGVYLVRDLSDGSIEVGQLYIGEVKGPVTTRAYGTWSFFGSDQFLTMETAPQHIEPLCKLDLAKLGYMLEQVNAEQFPSEKFVIMRVIAEKKW